MITEPGKSPQPYRLKLDRAETRIGRGSDNDILIEAGSASTNHCVMKRISGGFILEDLDSTNGIKIDDTRFRIIDLTDQLTVRIGDDVSLEFTLTEEELAELDQEDFTPQQQGLLPKSKPAPEPEKEEASEAFLEEPEDDDDWDDDEEEQDDYRPSTQKKAAKSGGMNGLLFFLLALLAIALGFYIRHYQDVLSKPPAPTEAPAQPTESTPSE
ncbi:FHA domain-containing protein [Rubritalea tangerina]|uniref:FHA domain-containing protein n=1 Tax=Rubritalea tangerina TaxID=430798 RepID=UPI0036099B8D